VKPGIVAAPGLLGAPATLVRALGIDAGPSRSGTALVSTSDFRTFAIETGMHTESGGEWIRGVIAHAARVSAVVAMETILGYAYESSRVQALVETARVEGMLLERAHYLGARTVPISAREWRLALCRDATASDEQVRVVIEGVTAVRPVLRAMSRPHVYDAAGIAIWALLRDARRSLVLPPAVSSALLAQQAHERALRADKKTRKAMGLPPAPKAPRSLTRAQSQRRSQAQKGRPR
jgi:hypothetical protein